MTTMSAEKDAMLGQSDTGAPRDRVPPLVVDFDGTCVRTNLFLECLLVLLKRNPFYLFALPIWLLKGRSYLERQVNAQASIDVSLVPYRKEFLNYIEIQRFRGHLIVLTTANDTQVAQRVAEYLMLFDVILPADRSKSHSRSAQQDQLVLKYGEKGFDYATSGRSRTDLLSSARRVILVHPSQNAKATVPRLAEVERIFEDPRGRIADYFSSLRPQHWVKNLLVFVPVCAAHRFVETPLLARSLVAFVALCCCASSGYLFNDLFDLAADRRHPRKRLRAFASGALPLSYAFIMIPTLAGFGLLLGASISSLSVAALCIYFALTLAYTLYIKTIVLLDVIVLAGLYTLRIIVGSVTIVIWPSPWLLAFSTFLFLSLALVKRYSELVIMKKIEGDGATARSYEVGDAELLAAKGTASAYLAVFVLALYITSGPVVSSYRRHEVMWLLCPLLLYWIGRIWLLAHRGEMADDPVVFAITDRTSLILIFLMLGTAVLAF